MAQGAPWIFLFFVLTYGATTLKNPLLSAYQNALIAPEQRATVLSLINLCTSLYVATFALVVGWLADVKSTPWLCVDWAADCPGYAPLAG